MACIYGCDNKANFSDYTTAQYIGEKFPEIETIKLDTIPISLDNTSGVGKWLILEKNIVFMDEVYSSMYFYDSAYNMKKRLLGRGDGPNEIQGRIVGFASHGDKIFILGPSYDYYEVDADGRVLKRGFLNFEDENVPIELVANNPKPNYKAIYEVEYSGLNIGYLNENEVIFSITTSHPELNAYISREFYEGSKLLGVLDLTNNKISGIYGKFSPPYAEYQYLPYYTYAPFDVISDNKFLMTFEADTMIYSFDGVDNLEYSFGNRGRDMHMDYRNVVGFEDYVTIHKEMRPRYGHFTFLRHIPALGITFRGYQKGLDQPTDGLQIYDNVRLIGDVDVPRGFRVVGFNNNIVYGTINHSPEVHFSESEPVLLSFKL